LIQNHLHPINAENGVVSMVARDFEKPVDKKTRIMFMK
jgi:hypothetical protein